jgi:CelD/BcsL family acetyltransferase involved in cellulose biosynthesis
VVLPLPPDVPTLHRLLKRNLVESLRRARNRLDRTGRPWTITTHALAADVRQTMPVLAGLHAARAGLTDRQRHCDQLAEPARLAFLTEALAGMAQRGQAEILTLDVEGTAIAAQSVLRAPDATYLGVSGVDPAWWRFSPVTLLQLRVAESAIGRGHGEFNLSTGPGVAKLRWSEHVRQHPEFIVCSPRRSSRLAFMAYRVAATAAGVRREYARHQVKAGTRGRRAKDCDSGTG